MGGGDNIDGGAGSDTLMGGAGDDFLDGGEGLDLVDYRLSAAAVVVNLADGVATGEGTDTLLNIEWVVGSNFDDSITGDDGANYLYGNGGNDTLAGGLGNDTLDGGGGNNTVDYTAATGPMIVNLGNNGAVGEGSDVLLNIQSVIGSGFADYLIGNAAANMLNGGLGNDTIIAGAGGNDMLDGGEGEDLVDYRFATTNVVLTLGDLGDGSATVGADTSTLIAVEHVVGSGFGDTLAGNSLGNFIFGGAGDDSLAGGGGNDTLLGSDGSDSLNGGVGDDVLTGGDGADYFYFQSGDGNDYITDFTIGVDKLVLSEASYAGFEPIFTALGSDYLMTVGTDTVIFAGLGSFDTNDIILI
ncbi:calcium-binding protein [Siccirubricoccus deserti]